MKRKRKKGKITKLAEYYLALWVFRGAHILPERWVIELSNFLGDILYFASSYRRNIAIDNISSAFKDMPSDEVRRIARQSCRSFFLTFLEIIKLKYLFMKPDPMSEIRKKTPEVDELFEKAKKIHDESGGCIFVTPHIGNWEILPRVSSYIGIPLTIVARPLDNEYLERLVFENRISTGQVIIPKTNAMFRLQKTLQSGISIGMLPDQSTMKGIVVEFFGRPATTTPVPAILAIRHNRPIVVVACCRKEALYSYEGFVCDPIWPEDNPSEKEEIIRLTRKMNHTMEDIIRKYPEQYLWIHNRWKTYRGKRPIMEITSHN